MAYLLGANVVSDLVRNPQGAAVEHVRRVGEANVCTSVIAAAELRFGAEKKGSLRLSRQLEAVLGALEVLPFEVPADAVYGEIRARLERVGRPIGGADLLIAAHALALGLTLVTDNESEFARVEGLKWENWLRRWAAGASAAIAALAVEAKPLRGRYAVDNAQWSSPG